MNSTYEDNKVLQRAEEILSKIALKYKAIFDSNMDAVVCMDTAGKIFSWNVHAEKLFGWKASEIIGKTVADTIVPPQYRNSHIKGLQHYLATEQGLLLNKITETTAINSEGNQFPVELTIIPFLEDGIRFFCAFIRDISERKKTQEKERKNLEQQKILSELIKTVSRVQKQEEIYELTLNGLQESIGADKASVLLFDENKVMQFFACRNLSVQYKKSVVGHSPWKADDIDVSAIFVSDVSKEPSLSTLMPDIHQEGICSLGFIPLLHQQQFLGKLMVYFTTVHYFTEEETQLLQNIANNIAFAIWEKKSEIALKESEAKYRAFFESSMDGILITAPNGDVLAANPAACEMFKMTEQEICLAGRTGLVDIDDPRLLPLLQGRREKGKIMGELNFIRKDGSKFSAELSSSIFIDAKGTEKTSMIIRDITERKRAEEELIKSKKQFQSLIENISGVYWVNDLNRNRTLYISPSFETIWGRKCEELYKDPAAFIEAIHPDDKERLFNLYKNLFNISQLSLSYRIIRPNGEIRWILARINVVDDHEGQKTEYGYAEDITEQKNAETIVRESENRLRTIYETEPECIKLLNSKGELLEMNPAGLAMIEADNLDMVKGKQVLGIVAPEYRNKFDRLTRNVFNGQSGTLEFKIVGLKGTHRWLETHAVPMKDASGNIIALLGVTRNITESKKAEQALKESEEKYRTLVEQASDGILVTDLQGIIIDMNSRLCAMFGYSKEEVVNKNVVEFLHPENMKQQPLRFNQLFGDQSLLLERVAVHRDGTVFDIELNTKLISNNRALSVIRNISERKKAEQLLRESEERYKALVENAPEALVVFDINEKRFVNVSETAGSLFKMTKDELLQIGPVEVSPRYQPDGQLSADLAIEKINLAIMGDKPSFEWTHRDKEGNPIPCEVRLVRLPSETKILLRGSIIDITDRKKAEQALKESEEKYRTLVEQASDPIVIYSLDGKILDYNHAFMSATGYQKENLEKMSLSDLLFEEDLKSRPIVFGGIKKGLAVHDVRRIKRKDGTAMSVELNSKMMPDGNIMVIGRDITERKKAEKELEDSYRAIRRLTDHLQNIREEERTHIAREIHDELGQQLTVMKMDISWINKKIAGSNDISMKEKTKELMALLDQTVKTVRRISSELRPSLLDDLGLTAAMEWQLHEFGRRSGIKTSLEIPPTDIKLSDSHKTGLFRIFQESLTNVARHSKAKQVDVVLSQEVKKLVLSITDNGHGFDKQKIAEKKTLGILGMKERTSMIGGSYEITSTPGKGTRVVVTIPLIKQ